MIPHLPARTQTWILLPSALLVLGLLFRAAPHGPAEARPGCAISCKCATGEGGEAEGFSQRSGDGLAPRTPNPWFFLERAYPFGRIPRELWQQAQLEARALKARGGQRGTWEFRGPTNIGGRMTDLAVDPVDAAVAFAGAAEGGVLRTTDRGQHWTPLFDDQPALSVGAVALDPGNPQVVYAGTGEVNPGGGSVAYGGAGIFRSTDRGDSWTPLGLEAVGSIGRIRIDPTNSSRIYVAAMGDLWSKGPDRGVYRSTDAGATWQNVLALSDSTGAVDLILRPDQPQTLFAAMWERIRRPEAYRYGGATCGVFKTTDGGDTWSLAGGGLPAPSTNLGRIGLSLCAAQPNTMYAVYADQIGYFAGLYKTTNGGTNWTRAADGALSSVFASYGWWFGNCRAHPVDPNRVFVLGLDFYRSTNGGSSWSEVSGGMHVDHHALEFGGGTNPVIYEGNDGGLYSSTNGGTAWSFLPNQPITQFYRLAQDMQQPARLYGGAQDNGTVRTLTGALNDWTNIYGGDGFGPVVDYTNGSRIWAQYQYGSLSYSSNGGSSWTDATSGIGSSDRHNWNTPVRMDPSNPNRMYYGTQRVYRSTNGTSWTAISSDLSGGTHGGTQGQLYGTITTIDVSRLDGGVIWAGCDDGYVQVTTNGGTNWTNVSGALPDRWVTSVRCSPSSRSTCYVTISGFRWDSPLPHVFRTTDMGARWTAIAGNLPEAPANDVAIDPLNEQRIFVATDLGVYETMDGGVSWGVLGGNLPNVVVTQFVLNTSTRILTAATYGRSMFSYDINQSTAVEPMAGGGESTVGLVHPPYPNPARDGVWIAWEPAGSAPVTVDVYSVSGRRVWSQETGRTSGAGGSTGPSRVYWNVRELDGRRVAAGTYFCRVCRGARELGSRSVVVQAVAR
jgi:photosystem II stability/assembly factor-like uncharacterized protein